MKNYEEMARAVLAERDRILSQRKKRRKAAMRSFAAAFGVCAVCCLTVVLYRHPGFLRPLPPIGTVESTTSGTETTAYTSAPRPEETVTTAKAPAVSSTQNTPPTEVTTGSASQTVSTHTTTASSVTAQPPVSSHTTASEPPPPPQTDPIMTAFTTPQVSMTTAGGNNPTPPPIENPTGLKCFINAADAIREITSWHAKPGAELRYPFDIYDRILGEGYLITLAESAAYTLDTDDGLTLRRVTQNEDAGILSRGLYEGKPFVITVCFADSTLPNSSMSAYLRARLPYGDLMLRETTVQGRPAAIQTFAEVDGSERYQGYFFLDDSHYCIVRTALPESTLLELMGYLHFDYLQLTT